MISPFKSSKLMWPHPSELSSMSLTLACWPIKSCTSQLLRCIVSVQLPVTFLTTWNKSKDEGHMESLELTRKIQNSQDTEPDKMASDSVLLTFQSKRPGVCLLCRKSNSLASHSTIRLIAFDDHSQFVITFKYLSATSIYFVTITLIKDP